MTVYMSEEELTIPNDSDLSHISDSDGENDEAEFLQAHSELPDESDSDENGNDDGRPDVSHTQSDSDDEQVVLDPSKRQKPNTNK